MCLFSKLGFWLDFLFQDNDLVMFKKQEEEKSICFSKFSLHYWSELESPRGPVLTEIYISHNEQSHPQYFPSTNASANRSEENISPLTEGITYRIAPFKLFSWQKFVSALRAKYIHER